ncbi:MAG: integrase arm-type DNA-binding domain-containing protein [Xanthobacteraceae bacterium]
MPLTDTAARQAKPRPKSYRLADGHGLYLEVVPSGSRYWRLKYRFADKEKRLAIGVYPIVSLAKARQVATEARSLLMDGIDPSVKKRERKRELKRAAANSFEAVAREWHTTMSPKWTPHHADDVIESLEKDIFPALGQRPIVDLKAPELLDAIRKIEKRGAIDIAQRVRQRCSAIFAYAIGSGFVENNPITGMKGIFVTRKKEPRRMLPRAELPEFLRKLEGHKGDRMVQLALRLVILTMVRTVELRGARWQEFDFESNLWSIPAERIKTRAPHVVPLSRQAVAALNELKSITSYYELSFPGRSDNRKPISENTMLYALYRMGYHRRATTHGFRALASTILNESGKWSADAIERQLAHRERNAVRAAYHRAEYLDERTRMMQWWADFVDRERIKADGGNIIPLRTA